MEPLLSWRITPVGKFLSTAPSTRTWPSITTGGMTPGMAMEARMARRISPVRCTSIRPEVRLDATAKKGRDRSMSP